MAAVVNLYIPAMSRNLPGDLYLMERYLECRQKY
jgi:hypothetical protein